MADLIAKKKLEQYFKKYGEFKVALRLNDSFWKYFTYPSKEYDTFFRYGEQATDRYIFDDEIVIESDMESPTKQPQHTLRMQYKFYMTYVYPKLAKFKISHELWHSSNKSYHVHIFFNELNGVPDKRRMKETFIRWVLGCDRFYEKCSDCEGVYANGNKCVILENDVDMQMCHKHLIKLEGAWHHKSNKNKRLVRYIKFNNPNKLPKEVLLKYKALKKKEMRWDLMPESKHKIKMQCLDWLLNNRLLDGRKRALFILATNLLTNHDVGETVSILSKWNKLQRNYFSMAHIISYVEYLRNYGKPSCRYIKDILRGLGNSSICNGCKRYNNPIIHLVT